ncbi:MAG TPA: response regulator [Cytophagaceae bacterium]|jgi:CheY-like chemotaxis protein|nr:response regulator [Cytophagaceae bacterium]
MVENKLSCVLLIDDDSINNFLNERLLKKLQISNAVKTALNGAEGLKYIDQHCAIDGGCCPELVFLDINMPVMDGFEFIRNFRKLDFYNKDKMTVAILTTSRNEKDIEAMKHLGAYHFVNKPLTAEKVKKVLTDSQ